MSLAEIRRRIRADAKLLAGNRSFLFEPSQKPKARILLLHGFSASPWEVKELGQHLKKKGFLVYAPRIAGHGESRKAFESSRFRDWMHSAEEAFSHLHQDGEKIILIGHSAGGNLATLLAAAHPHAISCLVLGAPAYRLADPTAPLSLFRLARWFRPSLHFEAEHPDSKYWTLDYSTLCIAELVRAGRAAAKAVQTLKLPVLMLQAEVDSLVSRSFNEKIFPKIPSPSKQLEIYAVAEHNVFHRYNPLQAEVFGWVDAFLKKFGK